MKKNAFIATGVMGIIFTLVILLMNIMIYIFISNRNNNDYVIEKTYERLNITDTNNTDAFQNIVNYTK